MLLKVRITSKRQITIPSKVFKVLGLKEGDTLTVSVEESKMTLNKVKTQLDELGGSLKLPEKYKDKSIEFIINEAKEEYFAQRYRK